MKLVKNQQTFLVILIFHRELNIDYYFIASAYEYIEQYFTEKTQGERREMAAYK